MVSHLVRILCNFSETVKINNDRKCFIIREREELIFFYYIFSTPKMNNEYNIAHLIFVKLTIFISRLPFILKGNNNETDEYIDHEECNDDDINKVEAGHNLSVIMNRTMIFLIRVD